MARSSGMFDQEVVDEMRQVFDRADKDGNGEINAEEACKLFAQHCEPTASPEEIRRTASGLRQQLDADRSGTISFDEYCFRFGRRLQMKRAQARRSGTFQSSAPSQEDADAAELRQERERLEREREALRREREDLRHQQEAGASAQGSSTAAAPSEPRLAAGSRVTLTGLRTAALNGRVGEVVSFDEAALRYVVLLDGTHKSLKPENLRPAPSQSSSSGHQVPSPSTGPSFTTRLQQGLGTFATRVQIFLSEYEWWQIALAIVIIAVFIGAYFEVTAKYQRAPGKVPVGRGSGLDDSELGRDEQPWGRHDNFDDTYESMSGQAHRRDNFDDTYDSMSGRAHRHNNFDDTYEPMSGRTHRHSGQYHQQGGYATTSMLGGGNLWPYACIGVLGYLCWTGVIPVHRMSWFQIYMLWSIIEPFIFGGRRGGARMRPGFGGYGGFGRRRGFL